MGNNPEYCYSVSTHVNCQKYRCAICVILVYVTITGPFMFCPLAAMCCPMHSVLSLCSNVLSCAHRVLSFCGKLCYPMDNALFPCSYVLSCAHSVLSPCNNVLFCTCSVLSSKATCFYMHTKCCLLQKVHVVFMYKKCCFHADI